MARSIEKKRARRRRITLKLAARRRARHLAIVHNGDASTVDCVCELAPFYFDKRRVQTCSCAKRKPGRPRAWVGMCDGGKRSRIYRWRAEVRKLNEAITAGREVEPEEDAAPRRRHRAKPYAIERSWSGRTWNLHRRYATEAERDHALATLRRNATGRTAYRIAAGV